MDWTLLPKTRRDAFFLLLVLAVPFVFFFVGIPAPSLAKDAAQYNSYAANIVTGHGYSIDGTTFSSIREPGYPFFLAIIYAVFGVQNIFAVVVIQTLLLGLMGYIVYRVFSAFGERSIGVVAGLATSLLPSYGLYAHVIGTEIPFAFLLALLLYLSLRVVYEREDSTSYLYGGIGLVFAIAVLVRVQLLFFLPYLLLCYVIFTGVPSGIQIKKMALAGILFVALIGSWMAYVDHKTDSFSITSGRTQSVLYTRAVRAQLSYAQLTQYAIDWIHRSISGGEGTVFLNDNEYEKIQVQFGLEATTTALLAAYEKQSIATILHNPGHYLYGNLIEVLKLSWIEHDYSDFLNRYTRASMYFAIYGLFLFGLIQLKYSGDRKIKALAILSTLFIAYNYFVLTFFDTIPRYNTPYLFFFMITGFCGIVLWKNRRIQERI